MPVLVGASVVDGTGAPARLADVVIEGDRIVAVVDPGDAGGDDTIRLDGLVLSPGFIDPHTHYDAQVLWDPEFTPSSWHGVTTVMMGNCGFGIAPTRPEFRETIARTLENVEGMSLDALLAGIDWSFSTFPEYLDRVESAHKRLNVGAMIGHTALRLYVLGDDATQRNATPQEIATMHDIVGEAMDAGAMGFSTSRNQSHAGDGGLPVPSRLSNNDELYQILDALGERKRGVVQATFGPDLLIQEFSEISVRTGRPVTWTAVLATTPAKIAGMPSFETFDQQRALPGEVYPQIACRPIVSQVTLADPNSFARSPAFLEVLAQPHEARAAVYADPEWRVRARVDLAAIWGQRYDRITVQESERHPELVNGPNLAQLAAARGVDPLDVLCDLSIEEDLRTRFRLVSQNDDEVLLAKMLLDPSALLGLSDAGAHASQLCDACYSTWLLQHWVREERVLTLEQAVWRLTGHPATVFRIPGRGRIAEGFMADLVAFDPDRIRVGTTERVWDLPAGADRLIVRSEGIEHVWVNGVAIREKGEDLPNPGSGVLIRGGTE